MPFQKGQSGNPAGRPRGSRSRSTLLVHDLFEGELEAIARKTLDMAIAGDIAAIRICLDRLAPTGKNRPIICALPPLDTAAATVAAAGTIVAEVAAGDLTAAEAADLAKVVDLYVRTLETRSFGERLTELEGGADEGPFAPTAIAGTSSEEPVE